MPTYEYRCKECGHDLEVVQSFSDDPLETCPECQGSLKKVYGNVGISFKGSGFYKTDSRGGKKSTTAASSSSSDSSSSSSSDSSTKTDSSTKSDSSKKSESSTKATTAASSSKSD